MSMMVNFITKRLWIYYESSKRRQHQGVKSMLKWFSHLDGNGDDTTSRERDSDTWSNHQAHAGFVIGSKASWYILDILPPHAICTRVQPTVKRTAVLQWNCVIGALHVMSTVTNLINSSLCVYDSIQPCCGQHTHTHYRHNGFYTAQTVYFYIYPTHKPSHQRKCCAFLHFQKTSLSVIYKIY